MNWWHSYGGGGIVILPAFTSWQAGCVWDNLHLRIVHFYIIISYDFSFRFLDSRCVFSFYIYTLNTLPQHTTSVLRIGPLWPLCQRFWGFQYLLDFQESTILHPICEFLLWTERLQTYQGVMMIVSFDTLGREDVMVFLKLKLLTLKNSNHQPLARACY